MVRYNKSYDNVISNCWLTVQLSVFFIVIMYLWDWVGGGIYCLSDQLTHHTSLSSLSVCSAAECNRSGSIHWDVTERWGWVREGNCAGEASKPYTILQKLPQLHRLTQPCPTCPPDSPPDLCTFPPVKSESQQPQQLSVKSAWRHLSCGSCHPRSWASSWSALGSSGAWCCCISPSSSEPATRTALCWGSRSWTSASATSRPWLRRTKVSWMGPMWVPWQLTVSSQLPCCSSCNAEVLEGIGTAVAVRHNSRRQSRYFKTLSDQLLQFASIYRRCLLQMKVHKSSSKSYK